MDPLLVSVEQAAQSLGIGRSKAYELIGSGSLPHVRLGRRTLVPTRALSEWVDQQALASRLATPAFESTGTGAKAPVTSELGNPFGSEGRRSA